MNKILKHYKWIFLIILASIMLHMTACVKPRPRNPQNICSIFRQYPVWYWDIQTTQKEWKVPISVVMSIIYQESHFNARAQPPRRKLLWIIPWFRPSSSYGYSQAVNNTWRHYQRDTGRSSANRDAFGDAADFIGWYANQAHIRAGISKNNAYQIYLAYHEGIGGYSQGTYRRKKWLISVARTVQNRARTYSFQLAECQDNLPTKPWWRLW